MHEEQDDQTQKPIQPSVRAPDHGNLRKCHAILPSFKRIERPQIASKQSIESVEQPSFTFSREIAELKLQFPALQERKKGALLTL